MVLKATHSTIYHYPRPSVDSYNEVRLMPIDSDEQLCMEFDLLVDPYAKVFSYEEPGGPVHHFSVREPHHILQITATAVVATFLKDPFQDLNLLENDWNQLTRIRAPHAEFLSPSRYVVLNEEVRAHAVAVDRDSSVATYVLRLNDYLNDLLDYSPDVTHVHSTLHEVLQQKAGVCQDFAHLMIACCRMVGIPARYVSGYLYVGEGEHLRGDQATHAWVDCLMPNGRWLGVDPTNRQLANDHYIRVHTGVDYGEVTPTRGVYSGWPADRLEVKVSVFRDQGIEAAALV